jgi:hypothetical protein
VALRIQIEVNDQGQMQVGVSDPKLPPLVLMTLLLDAAKAVSVSLMQSMAIGPAKSALIIPRVMPPSLTGG